MRHTIIDTSNLELTEKVVTIKRVTKVVKGGRRSAREKKTPPRI